MATWQPRDEDLGRVILTHQQSVAQVKARVTDFAETYWKNLGSWRDEDMQRFVSAVVPVVESGQMAVYRLTDVYLTTVLMGLQQEGAVAVPPATRPAMEAAINLRGISGREVYLRPGSTVHAALADGKSLEEAVNLGLYRLQDLIAMDMQLAQTHAARDTLSRSDRNVGYRRVLTGSENCALCALASTQRYHRSDLMPIHPGCDCTVAPIIGDRDPGQVINEGLLREIDAQLRAQGVTDTHGGAGAWVKSKATGDRYNTKRDVTNVMIRTHGEYGPTLTWRDQAFTGPSDIG